MHTDFYNKKDSLEILSVDLLKEKELFSIFKYWSKCLGIEVGWHYPLDLIWIMKKIKESNIPNGATILDAGAGGGLLQFLLAHLGFNILSIDYAERNIPKIPSLFFDIRQKNVKHKFKSSYIKHLSDNFSDRSQSRLIKKTINKLKSLGKISYIIFLKELTKSNKIKYGSITLHKTDFKNMKEISDGSIDCIVSVSSLEHNNQKEIKEAVTEFNRVLKPGGPMFLTTSATEKENWFHKPSYGWCFSEKTLIDLFSLNNPDSNFDNYKTLFQELKNNQYLQENLSSYYFHSEKSGMPYGKWNPLYQPVGITKYKQWPIL